MGTLTENINYINYSKGTLILGNKEASKEFIINALEFNLIDYKKLIIIDSIDYLEHSKEQLDNITNSTVVIGNKDNSIDINAKVKLFNNESGNKVIVLASDKINLSSILDLLPIARAYNTSIIVFSESMKNIKETWKDNYLTIIGNLKNLIKM